jgi:hypothetical protein
VEEIMDQIPRLSYGLDCGLVVRDSLGDAHNPICGEEGASTLALREDLDGVLSRTRLSQLGAMDGVELRLRVC